MNQHLRLEPERRPRLFEPGTGDSDGVFPPSTTRASDAKQMSPLLPRAAGPDSPRSARWQLRLFTPVAFCICSQPTSGDRWRRRGANAATGQLNRAQKQDIIPVCLSGFTRRTSGRWSYLWGGSRWGNVRSRGGGASRLRPPLPLQRLGEKTGGKANAELLCCCWRVPLSLFCWYRPHPPAPVLYYKPLFPRHNTRESPSQAEPLSNSSERFLIPTHGFCFRLDSRARQTPPLSGWLAIAGCCATVRVI